MKWIIGFISSAFTGLRLRLSCILDLWDKYSLVFDSIWVASAFKGATGPCMFVTDSGYHIENHRGWIDLMALHKHKFKNLRGICLTGWSRYVMSVCLSVHCVSFIQRCFSVYILFGFIFLLYKSYSQNICPCISKIYSFKFTFTSLFVHVLVPTVILSKQLLFKIRKSFSDKPIPYSIEYTRRHEHRKSKGARVFRSKSIDVEWLRGIPELAVSFFNKGRSSVHASCHAHSTH